MFPNGGIGGKYAIGRMAEISVVCIELISKIQEETELVSRDVAAMEKISTTCKDGSSCFTDSKIGTINKKMSAHQIWSLTKARKLKTPQDARFKQLYKKLVDLEDAGRLQWLQVFMYISNYMKILRPVARSEWDKPKKFVKRQTLILDGPYPGISNDLIIVNNKPIKRSGKISEKSSMGSTSQLSPVNMMNMDFESLESGEAAKPERKIVCDCLDVGLQSSRHSGSQRKRLFKNQSQKHLAKYDYCKA